MLNDEVQKTHLNRDSIMRRVATNGSLEGDLGARYSRLRRRIDPVEPGGWLYYAGASALKRCPNASRFAAEIFRKLQLPAGIFPFEGCSGQDILQIGFEEIARKVAEVVWQQIKAAGPCGIICGMEHDQWMFSRIYPAWGYGLDMPIVTASQFLTRLYTEGLVQLSQDADDRRPLFCGSLWSRRWLNDEAGCLPVLRAVYSERLTALPGRERFCLPDDLERGPARPDTGAPAISMERLWESILDSGTNLLVTDDPFTYELLYDRAFRTGILVWDFCHVFARHLSVPAAV